MNKQETVIKHKSKVTRTRGKTRKFTKKKGIKTRPKRSNGDHYTKPMTEKDSLSP